VEQEEEGHHEDDGGDDAAEERGEDRSREFRACGPQIDNAHRAEFLAWNGGDIDPAIDPAEAHFEALRAVEDETGADCRAHLGIGEKPLRVRDTGRLLAGEQSAGAVDQVDGENVAMPDCFAGHGLRRLAGAEVAVVLRAHGEMVADGGGPLFDAREHHVAQLIIIRDGLEGRDDDEQRQHLQCEVARRRPDERAQQMVVERAAHDLAHVSAVSAGSARPARKLRPLPACPPFRM